MTTSTTSPRRTGLDLQWVDPGTRPQDDLFGHVNGRWLQTHEIPDDRAQDGAFRALRDRAEADVRAIVEEAARRAAAPTRGRSPTCTRSFMDVERIEAARHRAAAPAAGRDRRGRRPRAELAGRARPAASASGGAALFGAFVATDAKDSTRYLVHLSQSGLGLPDESYYREDAYAEIRDRLRRAPGPARRAGRAARAGRLAETVMELETALAARVLGPGDQPGRGEDLHPDDAAPRCASTPRSSTGTPGWPRSARPTGAFDEVVVRQPSFVAAAARAVGRAPARAVAGLAGHPHRVGAAPTT